MKIQNQNHKYPSVTQILSKYQDFSNINSDTLDRACERGTAVHKACAAYAKGSWIPCPAEWQGYVDSFIKWFNLMVINIHLIEQRFTYETYGYTGQPDFIVTLKGDDRPTVVDNKTSASFKHIWAGQMAGYLHLVRKIAKLNAWRCITLRLSQDGNMPLVDSYSENKRDLQAFLSAVNAHRYFIE